MSAFGNSYQDSALLSSGRQVIGFVLERVDLEKESRKTLLLACTCDSVIESFVRAGYGVDFSPRTKTCPVARGSYEKLRNPKLNVLLLHGDFELIP